MLAAMRPRQWTKNLLVLAGLVFAAKLGDAHRWLEAVAAFGSFCAASSAAYLVNDLADIAADRRHPVKRRRPIASGALPVGRARVLALGLAAVSLGIAAVLGGWTLACVGCFLGLQLAYSLRLKHVVLVDVAAIAILFVVRAAAGAVAVDVRISPWLLVCTALLAFFLALGKRRSELAASGGAAGRPVLARYSLRGLDRLVAIVALVTVGVYASYALTARHGSGLGVTIPFVVFGLARYHFLLRRGAAGRSPTTCSSATCRSSRPSPAGP